MIKNFMGFLSKLPIKLILPFISIYPILKNIYKYPFPEQKEEDGEVK